MNCHLVTVVLTLIDCHSVAIVLALVQNNSSMDEIYEKNGRMHLDRL